MINILISSDSRYPVNRKIIKKAVNDTFGKYNIDALDAEVSIAIVGERKMKTLCSQYLNDNQKHEVLSFAQEELVSFNKQGFVNAPDEILRLGDVIICWPYLLESASSDNQLVDDTIYSLTAHGVEHLLGEHHN